MNTIKNVILLVCITFLISSCSSNTIDKNTSSAQPAQQNPNPENQAPNQTQTQQDLNQTENFPGMLDSHNRIRAKHNIPPLKWSKKLADYSMQWAKHLSQGNQCQMYHRSGNPPFGENLYRSTAVIWSDGRREVNPVTIRKVVKAWTDEEKWYNYNNNSCQAGQQCGHYTQAVWRDTTEVGCAMQICGDKSQVWVCSYNPPGNYRGVKPY